MKKELPFTVRKNCCRFNKKTPKRVSNVAIIIQQKISEFKFGCNLFVLHQLATPELHRKYEAACKGEK
jgi:hypothetical protein